MNKQENAKKILEVKRGPTFTWEHQSTGVSWGILTKTRFFLCYQSIAVLTGLDVAAMCHFLHFPKKMKRFLGGT